MKVSGKMSTRMANVRKKSLTLWFIYSNIFVDIIGKLFWNDGSRYEGEWRDGKYHGQGKLVLNDGERYEGYWKDDNQHGQGKKEVITIWFIGSNIHWWFNR